MPLVLPRANPLAYPAGVAPGFDPKHVAAALTMEYSAIGFGAGAINLLTGVRGTNVGAPTAAIKPIGPCTTFGGGTNDAVQFPMVASGVAVTSFTAGFIFIATSATVNSWFGSFGYNGGGTLFGYTGSSLIGCRIASVANLNSAAALVPGVMYFFCISANHPSAWDHNCVVVRLDTGQMVSNSVTGTVGAANTPFTNNTFGNFDTSSGWPGQVACGMLHRGFKSLSALQMWAADPWSFWYPRRQFDRVGQAAAGGFKPYWANRNNDFAVGTGLQ